MTLSLISSQSILDHVPFDRVMCFCRLVGMFNRRVRLVRHKNCARVEVTQEPIRADEVPNLDFMLNDTHNYSFP